MTKNVENAIYRLRRTGPAKNCMDAFCLSEHFGWIIRVRISPQALSAILIGQPPATGNWYEEGEISALSTRRNPSVFITSTLRDTFL